MASEGLVLGIIECVLGRSPFRAEMTGLHYNTPAEI